MFGTVGLESLGNTEAVKSTDRWTCMEGVRVIYESITCCCERLLHLG
jgi:hypothetical protein